MVLPSLAEERANLDGGAGTASSPNSFIEPPPASYASKSGFIAIQTNSEDAESGEKLHIAANCRESIQGVEPSPG